MEVQEREVSQAESQALTEMIAVLEKYDIGLDEALRLVCAIFHSIEIMIQARAANRKSK